MRRSGAIMLAVACLAPIALAALPAPPPVLWGILIEGDAGFLDPLSGVVSGSGTETDPYIIAGWTVLHRDVDAVRLINTTAHVILRDLTIPGEEGIAFQDAECLRSHSTCVGSVAVHLVNASNVRIERGHFAMSHVAFVVDGGAYVDITDVNVTATRERMDGVDGFPYVGFVLRDARNVLVGGVDFSDRLIAGGVWRTQGLSLTDIDVAGQPSVQSIHMHDTVDVSLERSRFRGGTGIWFDGRSSNIRVAHNTFDAAGGALHAAKSGSTIDNVEFCGNEVRNDTWLGGAVSFDHARNATVRGNLIENTYEAVVAHQSVGVSIMANRISGARNWSVVFNYGSDHRAHGNSFSGNPEGLLVSGAYANVSDNWWGDASGPAYYGPGTGDRLFVEFDASATYAPWLTSDPQPVVGCT